MTRTEQHLKALDSFKDWSNYLLITTVAAIGWVASLNYKGFEIWFFALSAIFGIFTLGLIPLVATDVSDTDQSFYDVRARFKPFWMWGPEWRMRIKWMCWPQHILFIAGIIAFAVHSTSHCH
jgi:hypothetical protein